MCVTNLRLVMIVGAGLLAPLLGLPQTLLTIAGAVMIPWLAALVALSRMLLIPCAAVRAVVAANIVWVLGSVAVLIAFSPSALGYAFVIAQALAVGLFTEPQILALKRELADA